QVADDGLDDAGNVGDAAAAAGDRHGLARLDAGPQVDAGELLLDLAFDVFDLGPLPQLADAEHLRILAHGGGRAGGGRPPREMGRRVEISRLTAKELMITAAWRGVY